MATEIPGLQISLPADVDLSGSQFLCAKIVAPGELAVAAASTDIVAGILQDNTADVAGKPAAIMVNGVSKVVAGGALASGIEVSSTAGGKAVASAIGDFSFGITIDAAGGADEIISVLLIPNRQHA